MRLDVFEPALQLDELRLAYRSPISGADEDDHGPLRAEYRLARPGLAALVFQGKVRNSSGRPEGPASSRRSASGEQSAVPAALAPSDAANRITGTIEIGRFMVSFCHDRIPETTPGFVARSRQWGVPLLRRIGRTTDGGAARAKVGEVAPTSHCQPPMAHLHAFETPRQDRRARVVPEGLHRW